MNYMRLNGFLFAVTSAPELIKPSAWMPLIFDEQEANYATEEEAESVLQSLMDLYNELNHQMFSGKPVLPHACVVREPAIENLAEETPLAQWSIGFFIGHSWLDGVWGDYLTDELDEELGSCMMILSFFADQKLAETYCHEATKKNISVAEMSETVCSMFTQAMASYADMGRSIYQAVTAENFGPYERDEAKVGRNDPCPCGSGKKYKRCCLH